MFVDYVLRKLQSVDIISYIVSHSPDVIPFFPCVLCKSYVSAHKLEIGTRKSKPSGVLETSPIWITRQHNSNDCIVCKI